MRKQRACLSACPHVMPLCIASTLKHDVQLAPAHSLPVPDAEVLGQLVPAKTSSCCCKPQRATAAAYPRHRGNGDTGTWQQVRALLGFNVACTCSCCSSCCIALSQAVFAECHVRELCCCFVRSLILCVTVLLSACLLCQ